MNIIAVETSCDETAVALFNRDLGLINQLVYSQAPLHAQYGGVVPELASRDHIRTISPLLNQLLNNNGSSVKPDGVAYTAGPGLLGALLVGASLARSLAYAWHVPSIGIHHLEGHMMACMLEDNKPSYPFLCLLVSGGHTLLVAVKAFGDYQILGSSLDDAAGEAFDKIAKLMDLGYPGGPQIAKQAEKGNAGRFKLPCPMLKNAQDLNFSFSGLKTAAMQQFMATKGSEQDKADIALALQNAIVTTLVEKCRRGLAHTQYSNLVVAGGVAANTQLRSELEELTRKLGCRLFIPRPAFCTDNAAMIAYPGAVRLSAGQRDDLSIQARAKWPLDSLKPVKNDLSRVLCPLATD